MDDLASDSTTSPNQGQTQTDAARRARQVDLVLQRVESLPTLGPVAARLMRIASDDDAELDEIVRLIESDPALTGRILSLCSRADIGAPRSVTTVRKAVVMLGLEAVQTAALSVSVYGLLEAESAEQVEHEYENDPSAEFDRVGFWRHAIGVASAAELIASAHKGYAKNGETFGVSHDEAFCAGLLHGVGKLVLELVLPRSYQRVLSQSGQRRCDSAPVERKLIGVDHYTAGKRIAEHWGLPASLRDVLWLHGQPMASVPELPHRDLVGVVSAAKALCRDMHVGWSGDFGAHAPASQVAADAGLDPALVESVSEKVYARVQSRTEALGIEAPTPERLLLESIAAANAKLGRSNRQLEAQARAASLHAEVLESVIDFHASLHGTAERPGHADADRTVAGTLGGVVRSATRVLGDGFYLTIYQSDSGEPWHIHQFDRAGRMVRSQPTEPPPDGHGKPSDLAELASPMGLSVQSLSALPWLSDFVAGAIDIRKVRMLPLTHDRRSDTKRGGPAAILMHDRDLGASSLNGPRLEALRSTWGGAVVAAARQEEARELGEQLADRNRALAEAQARLTETESMARLGEMTAGAAHEMNNPLTVISGRSQLLKSRLKDESARAAAKAIYRASQDLDELVTSLHLIASPPEPRLEALAVGPILHNAVECARERLAGGSAGASTAGETIMLRTQPELSPGLPMAMADRELLPAALAELIANAAEAHPGGVVTLRVRQPAQHAGADGRLAIAVIDRGPGMSPKARKHAFDPFFSEKQAGRQRGLGLARARRVVELMGGSLTLEPHEEDGQVNGTQATIWLGTKDSAAGANDGTNQDASTRAAA